MSKKPPGPMTQFFTPIANHIILDDRITPEAFRLYAYYFLKMGHFKGDEKEGVDIANAGEFLLIPPQKVVESHAILIELGLIQIVDGDQPGLKRLRMVDPRPRAYGQQS